MVAGGQIPQARPQKIVPRAKPPALFAKVFKQVEKTFKRASSVADTMQSRSLALPLKLLEAHQTGPSFMYIIPEDPATLTNPKLSAPDIDFLTKLLAKKRSDNALLAQEVGALFGPQAEKQAIVLLTTSENDSFQNASTCPTLKQCLSREKQINRQTQIHLNQLFKTHKHSFNYKAKSGSSDWNSFYKRVNDFRRASN